MTRLVVTYIFVIMLWCYEIEATGSNLGRTAAIDFHAMYAGTQVLTTERLTLRPITVGDAEDVFNIISNPEVETWNPIASNLADVTYFIQTLEVKYAAKEPSLWGIADKKTNKLIGYAGFTHFQPDHSIVELEYALDKPYWNYGFMSEALKVIVAFAFDILRVNRILAFTCLDNIRSQKVLMKAGMKFEGLHKEAGYTRGAFWDMKSYALIRQDYLASQNSKK